MGNKIFFIIIILLLSFPLLLYLILPGKEPKYTSIKLIVREHPEAESSIKSSYEETE